LKLAICAQSPGHNRGYFFVVGFNGGPISATCALLSCFQPVLTEGEGWWSFEHAKRLPKI
jgi:hypothetical protein